jgi:hypothetical protein
MSLLINKTIPRYKIISTPPPFFRLKKTKTNKKQTKQTNKQKTQKLLNQLYTLIIFYPFPHQKNLTIVD